MDMIYQDLEIRKKISKKAILNIKKQKIISTKLYVKAVNKSFIGKDWIEILQENIDAQNVAEDLK